MHRGWRVLVLPVALSSLGIAMIAGALPAAGVTSVPASTRVVSSGTITIKGTWSLNLDTGKLGGGPSGNAIFWEQISSTKRHMVIAKGGDLHNLGVVTFSKYGPTQLKALSYNSTWIAGSVGKSNKLVDGDVFAVHTSTKHFAKVKVIKYGYNIKVTWVTYA